eukprot:scaffold209587_cov30-Tisochrysis_lutea.AAC.3
MVAAVGRWSTRGERERTRITIKRAEERGETRSVGRSSFTSSSSSPLSRHPSPLNTLSRSRSCYSPRTPPKEIATPCRCVSSTSPTHHLLCTTEAVELTLLATLLLPPSAPQAACSMGAVAIACATVGAPFAIARDGRATHSEQSAKEWLLASPHGAYTTARTCSGGTRLFEWETHIARTAASAAAMLANEANFQRRNALIEAVGSAAALRPRLDENVAAAVRLYKERHQQVNELKVTILVTWQHHGGSDVFSGEVREGAHLSTVDDTLSSVHVHVGPLPPLPTPPVRVEVRGAPRSNALAKDSSWVSDRAPLEELLRPDFNELLLATEDGDVLEGSQTNFFVLQGGKLVTAGKGVLEGTVRRLLLEVCEREGVPVVFRPPNLAECQEWDAAFVSSTSRLLLPVNELYVPESGKRSVDSDVRRTFEYSPTALAIRLRDMVVGEVEAHSVPISGG